MGDSARPILYDAIPDCMKLPWREDRSEIRITDVYSCKDLDEFKVYMQKYTGNHARFLSPDFFASADVRLSFATQPQLFRYILNYIGRDGRYAQEHRNCQTFTADLYGFLIGSKNVAPYHAICRTLYKPRTYLFLYE